MKDGPDQPRRLKDATAGVDRESNLGYQGMVNVPKERGLSSVAKWQRVQRLTRNKTVTNSS